MDALRIHGRTPLRGEVAVGGAKNAALPIMAATLLADGPVRLERIPRLRDVATLSAVLQSLGVDVVREPDSGLRLETVSDAPRRAGYKLVRKMRASFCVLGPLLARRGMAAVALPGGCCIGHRPVNLHLAGLSALGANIKLRRGYVIADAGRLQGAEIDLLGPRGPTVTGTANVMCAACLAKGTTVIRGAACEPEIVDLANFLNSLGARIQGAGRDVLEIFGVERICQTEPSYRIIADRIEAATLLIAVAATGGSAVIQGTDAGHLTAVLEVLRQMGVEFEIAKRAIRIRAGGQLQSFDAIARPYPSIPTDVQPLLTTLACFAVGRSSIADDVFPQRWRHAAELVRLGAAIEIAGSAVVVDGRGNESGQALIGANVEAHDLRGAASLVVAAVAAKGESVVHGMQYLDRGYQRLDRKLAALGAQVERFAPNAVPSVANR